MDPVLALAAIRALIEAGIDLAPTIQAMFQKGEITVEQQQSALTAYSSLKDKADGQFSGPEWKV